MEHALKRATALNTALALSAGRLAAVRLGAGLLLVGSVMLLPAGATASAKTSTNATRCIARAANGTGVTEKIAKFQVYEGLLKATDTSLWVSWMTSGTTPGYAVKGLKYRCANGSGLGVSCRGHAKVCKV